MGNYEFVKRIPANASFGGIYAQTERDMLASVESACREMLLALGIDVENDPNSKDTPRRMAEMYVKELLRGRYSEKPALTAFPNSRNLDQLYMVGPIPITSLCSHHFLPFTGTCFIGVLPAQEMPVLGLSKFARLTDWIFARPQIQEEATIQLADAIEEAIQPAGLGIVVTAVHQCMVLRGVKAGDAKMTTSVMRGALRENATLRSEFLALINNSK